SSGSSTRATSGASPPSSARSGPPSSSALLPDLEDVGVRLRRVGADGEGDRLPQLVLGRAALPGARQVALRSVGVAGGEVGRQIAEEGGLRIERALLVLPRRDHLLLECGHGVSFPVWRSYLARPSSSFATSPDAVSTASWPVLSS